MRTMKTDDTDDNIQRSTLKKAKTNRGNSMHVPVIFQPPGQVGQMSQTSGPVAAVGAMQQMKREMVQMQLENDDLR